MAETQLSTQRMIPARAARVRAPREGAGARRRFAGARVEASAAPLRPKGVGQILDTALDRFLAQFGVCTGIAFLCWLPVQIGSELFLRSSADEVFLLLWTLSAVPAVSVVVAAFVCAVVGSRVTGSMATGPALAAAVRRLPGILTVAVLTVALSVVGFACGCGLGSFAVSWLFAVAPAVYLLERTSILAAMGRSVRLVRGWGFLARWIGWAFVSWVMVLPLSGVSETMASLDVRQALDENLSLRGSALELTMVVLSALFLALATGYVSVVMTTYYFDSRIRKEGLDLELTLDKLSARSKVPGQKAATE